MGFVLLRVGVSLRVGVFVVVCSSSRSDRKIAEEGAAGKGTTHDFFLTLNTSLYLRNIPLSIVVYGVDLVLFEYGETLFCAEFSHAKTVSWRRPSHGSVWRLSAPRKGGLCSAKQPGGGQKKNPLQYGIEEKGRVEKYRVEE